jgi:hypothetical protein
MKKLLLLVAAAAGGFAAWRKVDRSRAEQALWAEATDPIARTAPPAPPAGT